MGFNLTKAKLGKTNRSVDKLVVGAGSICGIREAKTILRWPCSEIKLLLLEGPPAHVTHQWTNSLRTHKTEIPISRFAFTTQQPAFPLTLPSTIRMTSPPHSSEVHSFLWSHNTPLQWRYTHKKTQNQAGLQSGKASSSAQQRVCPKLHFQLLLLKDTSQAPLNRPVSKSWEQRRGFTKQLEPVCYQRSNLTFLLSPAEDVPTFIPLPIKTSTSPHREAVRAAKLAGSNSLVRPLTHWGGKVELDKEDAGEGRNGSTGQGAAKGARLSLSAAMRCEEKPICPVKQRLQNNILGTIFTAPMIFETSRNTTCVSDFFLREILS